MDFSFTAEQRELRRAVRDLAADRSTSRHVRAALESPTGRDDDLWRLVTTELGLGGIAVPEEYGGAGGSFVDAAVVIEEAGRSLMPVPLTTTLAAAAAAPTGSTDSDFAALLGDIAGGAAASVAVGALGDVVDRVPDVLPGDRLLVAAADGLSLATLTDDCVVESRPALDPTRRLSSVRVDPAATQRIGDAAAAARAVDVLRVALAVEAIGVARWCVETTVEYLKTRVQFDRPIGSFQALQHRAADLVVRLESAASTAYYAAWAVDAAADELPVVAPVALGVAASAAYDIAAETIQLHGGIGFTWEHDAHLYFKRATTTRLLLGDAQEQRRLVRQRSAELR